MKYVFSMAFLFFAILGLVLFRNEYLGKRKARQAPSISARLVDMRKAERDRRAKGNPYEVELLFEVPGHGRRSRMQSFALRSDAEAFASRFAVGNAYELKVDRTSRRQVFLAGDEEKINPTGLIAGVGFLALLVFFWTVGP